MLGIMNVTLRTASRTTDTKVAEAAVKADRLKSNPVKRIALRAITKKRVAA